MRDLKVSNKSNHKCQCFAVHKVIRIYLTFDKSSVNETLWHIFSFLTSVAVENFLLKRTWMKQEISKKKHTVESTSKKVTKH